MFLGILHMDGVGGKPGWFWLFVLMGTFTILSGAVLGFCLPDSFKNPHSTFAPTWHIFSEREIYILNKRVMLDDPAKGRKKKRIGKPAFKKAVSRLRHPRFEQAQLTFYAVQQLEDVGAPHYHAL